MGIDVSDARAEEFMVGNEGENLVIVSGCSATKFLDEGEELAPVAKSTHSQFPDDEWMHEK